MSFADKKYFTLSINWLNKIFLLILMSVDDTDTVHYKYASTYGLSLHRLSLATIHQKRVRFI